MPLQGFRCCQDHLPKPFEECIAECRKGSCLYPLHLLHRIPRKLKSRDGIPHDFSATALSMCPRRFALEDRFDFWEHPQDFIARDRGDGHHQWIEDSGPFEGIETEVRLFKTYELSDGTTFVLSGKADWVDTRLNEIGDHKTTGWMPKAPYDSHEAQLNVYADLWDGGREEPRTRTEECSRCEGTGWIDYSGRGVFDSSLDECSSCGGTGLINEPLAAAYRAFQPTRLWVEYFDGRSYQKYDVRVWSEGERYAFIIEKGEELLKTRVLPDYLPPKLPDWPKGMLCKYCPVSDLCEERE